MRIKSKDIHFFQTIFYLANKLIFDINFLCSRIYSINLRLLNAWYIYLLLKLKELASIPPASS